MSRGGPYEVTRDMVYDAINKIHRENGRVCYSSKTLARVIAEQQGFPIEAIEHKVRHHVSRQVRMTGLYFVRKEKPEGGGRPLNLYIAQEYYNAPS
jgi:hypothetical protein